MRKKSNFWSMAIVLAIGVFFSTQIKDLLNKVPFLSDIINKTKTV